MIYNITDNGDGTYTHEFDFTGMADGLKVGMGSIVAQYRALVLAIRIDRHMTRCAAHRERRRRRGR